MRVKRCMAVNLIPEKKKIVMGICDAIGLDYMDIEPWQYEIRVGRLCDNVDMTGGPDIGASEDTAGKINMDMLIFDGISSKELDIFLDRYKTSGLPAVQLKSVVTTTNREWTVWKLYTELAREYLIYKMRGM